MRLVAADLTSSLTYRAAAKLTLSYKIFTSFDTVANAGKRRPARETPAFEQKNIKIEWATPRATHKEGRPSLLKDVTKAIKKEDMLVAATITALESKRELTLAAWSKSASGMGVSSPINLTTDDHFVLLCNALIRDFDDDSKKPVFLDISNLSDAAKAKEVRLICFFFSVDTMSLGWARVRTQAKRQYEAKSKRTQEVTF